MKVSFVILCFFLFGIAASQISQEYLKQSESLFSNAIERRELEDYEIMFKEGYILKETIKKNLIQDAESIKTPDQAFYIIGLAAIIKEETTLKNACSILSGFIQPDGTSRAEISQPNSTNYSSSGFIIESIQTCHQQNVLTEEQVKKYLDIPLEKPRRTCIMHGTETIELTGKLFRLYSTLSPSNLTAINSFSTTYRTPILYFLKEEANSSILSTEEKYQITSAFEVNSELGVLVSKQTNYDLKKKSNEILFRFENMLGNQLLNIDANNTITGNLYKRDKLISSSLVSRNTTSQQYPFAIDILSSLITQAGFYSLRLSVDGQEVLEERLMFTTSVVIKSIEFEAAQGKGKIPKKYTHSLSSKQLKNLKPTNLEKILTNQNSFLYILFSLDFPQEDLQFSPSQVAVRLSHSTFTGVTHQVEAEYDDIQNQYLAIIDFGDPVTILPYTAVYDVEIIVADQRLTKSIAKVFAQADTVFKTNRTKLPPNDADYEVPKNIDHIINDTIISPPLPFITTFLMAMGFALIVFFILVQALELNSIRLQRLDGIQKFYVGLFVLAFVAAIGLLILFWVKINLLETVTYISIGVIPFILIGNAALNSLATNEEQKVNDS